MEFMIGVLGFATAMLISAFVAMTIDIKRSRRQVMSGR